MPKPNDFSLFVMNNAKRLNAPRWRLSFAVRITDVTGRIDRFVQSRFRAALTHGVICGEACIVLEKRTEIFRNAVSQITRQFNPASETCLQVFVGD